MKNRERRLLLEIIKTSFRQLFTLQREEIIFKSSKTNSKKPGET